MRQLTPMVLAALLVNCGGAALPAASPATPTAAPSATVAVVATPVPTYAPTAEGFSSKVLVEKPRNLAASAMGFVWIASGPATDASTVTAVVSDSETFTGAYQASTDRTAIAAAKAPYVTPDLPPLAAGRYTESLRLVVVQPGGRSAAHMHSGIEGVLVVEGRVLVRSAANAPVFLTPGQGFYILPKTPVQLINAGTTVARTVVYSISPEGAPFSTELDQAP